MFILLGKWEREILENIIKCDLIQRMLSDAVNINLHVPEMSKGEEELEMCVPHSHLHDFKKLIVLIIPFFVIQPPQSQHFACVHIILPSLRRLLMFLLLPHQFHILHKLDKHQVTIKAIVDSLMPITPLQIWVFTLVCILIFTHQPCQMRITDMLNIRTHNMQSLCMHILKYYTYIRVC
jgi:hypothetical protein